jgi:acyl-CoA thioester hydrolase
LSRISIKARCSLLVRHYECDPLEHVNYAVYLHYFEMGRLEAMAKVGLLFAAVLKQGYTVVASDVFVQYKAPAFSDDVLALQSWVSRFHRARMTRQ